MCKGKIKVLENLGQMGSVMIEWQINCSEYSFQGTAYSTYKDLNWTDQTDTFTPTEGKPIPRGSIVRDLQLSFVKIAHEKCTNNNYTYFLDQCFCGVDLSYTNRLR